MTERKVCPTHAPWTDTERAVLRTLWGGTSASLIAEKLPGRTRDAIIGAAHRLGLAGMTRTWPAVRKKPQAAKRQEEPVPIIPANVHLLRPTRPSGTVPIWELQQRHCRWVFGDPLDVESARYCAKDVTGETSSWCEEHRAIVFRSAPEATGRPFILHRRAAA